MATVKLRLLCFAVVAFAPPAILAMAGLCRVSWIAIGAALWGAAVILKIFFGIPVHAGLLLSRLGPKMQSMLWGAWSGLCELGTVALFYSLVARPATIGDALGVGIGAGSIEVLVVVGLGWVALIVPSRLLPREPPGDWFPRWSGVFERISTSAGHAASRALVWVWLQSPTAWPSALVALASFTAVDGVANYGEKRKWRWSDSRLSRRFNLFLVAVAAIESAALLLYLRR